MIARLEVLAKALHALEPKTDADAAEIARALGLTLVARTSEGKPSEASRKARRKAVSTEQDRSTKDLASDVQPATIPMELERLDSSASQRPTWLDSAGDRLSAPRIAMPPQPVPSLLAQGRQRALIRELLASDAPNGPVDVDAIIDSLSRGQLIVRIPRRRQRQMSERILLLLDTNSDMDPFASDQTGLVSAITHTVGLDRIRVRTFDRHLRSVVMDPETMEEEPVSVYKDWTLLILSGARHARAEATPPDAPAFVRSALQLDPYWRASNRSEKPRADKVLPWDTNLTARMIKRARQKNARV